MATLKLALDMRRAKKDGTFPLVFKLSVNREKTYITTGISVKPTEFHAESNLIIGNPKANEVIMKLDVLYRNRFYQYIINHQGHEQIAEAKAYILNKQPEEFTVAEYWDNLISNMNEAGRDGGVKVYQQSLNTIRQELNLDIPFSGLSFKDVMNLENKLYKRGMSVNGASVYLRSFRAVCNKAINQDIVNLEWYPFRKHKMKKQKTVPRVLTIDEIKRYFALNLSPTDSSYKYWNIGKLIFMLRGINMRDLMLLRPDCVKNGRIIYRRAKTGKLYSIQITPEITATIATFTPNETLLGLITPSHLTADDKINHFKQKVKVTNKHLKKIGVIIAVSEPISTYVFRYTYANVAKQLGYSKDLIAEALGHSYGNTVTSIYLEQFDNDVLDKMNQELISAVL
ncbi:MAG: site-specific integrase [Crocinitomicaceae bacterium]|nr:site-specific integrase [Crocinitomicaceae bacterium]